MLQLKANLLRKESAYEPRTCVVEKVIPMYGRSFEQFRQDLLEDNLCIHKYKDLMYIDPEDNAHCLLFVDADASITLNRYVHSSMQMKQQYVSRLSLSA